MDYSQFIPNIIEILEKYWRLFLLEGLKNTLILTCISVALGTVLGAVIALLRMSKLWILRFFSSVYIEVIRGTPILLQLYIFYFVLPGLLPFLKLSQFLWVSIALCVNSAAYVSEVIRSGIQAVDKGQTEAARSLGLSSWQAMRLVVLPQAIKNILPTLANELVTMVKESSICSTIGMMDLMWGAKNVAATTFISVGPYMVAALIYFCINYPAGKAIEAIERRMRRGDK
jgi:polar amino acid transport system permease protein